MKPTTGSDLRTERARARLTVTAVAREAGVTRQSMWRWELLDIVPQDVAARYRDAIARLTEGKAA